MRDGTCVDPSGCLEQQRIHIVQARKPYGCEFEYCVDAAGVWSWGSSGALCRSGVVVGVYTQPATNITVLYDGSTSHDIDGMIGGRKLGDGNDLSASVRVVDVTFHFPVQLLLRPAEAERGNSCDEDWFAVGTTRELAL